MELLTLAMLALSPAPGVPARLPLNPAVALQQPADLEHRWGNGEVKEAMPNGWRTLAWMQSWFGLKASAAYRLSPEGKLQTITVTLDDCQKLVPQIESDLGSPDESGPSPQFLNSLSYWRWHREGVAFVVENYEPGCEMAIYQLPQITDNR